MKMNDSKSQIRNPKMEIGLGLPVSIVESFDPIDDIELRLSPGFIVGPIDAVRFSGS